MTIPTLSSWIEKTAQAVKRICTKKAVPCVGFSLVFFDPYPVDPTKRWNYVIELAFDPHNPPTGEEKERIEKCLEYISEGIKRIYGDVETEDNGGEDTGLGGYRQ